MKNKINKFLSFVVFASLLPLSSCKSKVNGSIQFHFNGGVDAKTNITETQLNDLFKGVSGTAVDTTVPLELTRDGYYFLGWYENCNLNKETNVCSSYSGKIDFSNSDKKYIPYGDAHAYAVFKKEVSITINLNQSSFDSSMQNTNFVIEGYEGKAIINEDFPILTDINETVRVKYYYLDSTFYTDTKLTNVFNQKTFTGDNITLYAKWISNPEITFLSGTPDKKGVFDNGTDTYKTKQYAFNDKFEISSLPNVQRVNSTNNKTSLFDGWYQVKVDKNDSSKLTYTDYRYTFNVNPVGSEDIILYAKWIDVLDVEVNYPDSSTISSYIYETKTYQESGLLGLQQNNIVKNIENKTFSHFTYSNVKEEAQAGELFHLDETTSTSKIYLYAHYADYPLLNVTYSFANDIDNKHTVGSPKYVRNDTKILAYGSNKGPSEMTVLDNPIVDLLKENNLDLLNTYYIEKYTTPVLDAQGNPVTDTTSGKVSLREVSVDSTVGDFNVDLNVVLREYYKFKNGGNILTKLKLGETLTYKSVVALLGLDSSSEHQILVKDESDPLKVYYLDSDTDFNPNVNPTSCNYTLEVTSNHLFEVYYNNEKIYSKSIPYGEYMQKYIYEVEEILKQKGLNKDYVLYEHGTNTPTIFPEEMVNTNISFDVVAK